MRQIHHILLVLLLLPLLLCSSCNTSESVPSIFVSSDVCDPAHVTLSDISFSYHELSQTWRMSLSGYWLSPSAHHCDTGDVGKTDNFGIAFSDSQGVRPAMTGCYGFMYDGANTWKEWTTRSSPDTSTGVDFCIQDTVTPDSYLGNFFGATIYFDALFAQFHGTATPYYTHTCSNGNTFTILGTPLRF